MYEEYALLDAQIKQLTAKKEAMREQMIQEMLERGEDKVKTAVGTFSVSQLKTWTYPEAVLKIGEDFKTAKAKAESTGEATYVEKPSLKFTETKI